MPLQRLKKSITQAGMQVLRRRPMRLILVVDRYPRMFVQRRYSSASLVLRSCFFSKPRN
jgi:hypothetical protein